MSVKAANVRAPAPTQDFIRAVSNETLRVRVYNELKRALFSGGFSSGEAVVVRVVAERMGVGTMPVREAIQQLATEGGFEFLPNRTVRVPILSADDLTDVFEVRMRLEGFAASRAASRASSADVSAIATIFQNGKALVNGASPPQAMSANLAFHFAIYEAAHSPHLMKPIENLWLKVGPLLVAPYLAPPQSRAAFFNSLTLHGKLVAAIRDRDATAAEAHMIGIIARSLKWHLSALQQPSPTNPAARGRKRFKPDI